MDKLINSPDVLIKIIRIYVDTFLELMHLPKSSGGMWDDQRSLKNTQPSLKISKASERSCDKDQEILPLWMLQGEGGFSLPLGKTTSFLLEETVSLIYT